MKVLSVQPPMMDSSPRMQHALSSAAQFSPAQSPKAAAQEDREEECAADGPAEAEEDEQEQGVSEQAEQVEEQEPERELEGDTVLTVDCLCPTPEIIQTELDSSSAHLVWSDPHYAPGVSEMEDVPPPLQIHRFEVDWVRVCCWLRFAPCLHP
eukprot:1158726-Pelagomonas_calceolata.AAC.9